MRPMLRHLFKTLVTVLAVNAAVAADAPTSWGQWTTWGDQGDGTYSNPVLPSDYGDLDCIRVGPDYYAISSTMQSSPGMVILHSRDLVNWAIAGHAVDDLTQISPELNWNRMNRAGKAAAKPVTPTVKSVAAPGGKPGMAMKAAILKALASGVEMSKPALAAKVAVLRGTKTNLGTFSPLLRQMKGKEKTITNPNRGFWKLRKGTARCPGVAVLAGETLAEAKEPAVARVG
jgi:hypothetical protein